MEGVLGEECRAGESECCGGEGNALFGISEEAPCATWGSTVRRRGRNAMRRAVQAAMASQLMFFEGKGDGEMPFEA